MLEYVVAEAHSYCLAIGRDIARIVPLPSRESLEKLVASYLKTLKAKGASKTEGGQLYSALFKDIPEAAKKQRLIIVPHRRLHPLPSDALPATIARHLG